MHYYAMQYIEGKTLAELVRELRSFEGRDGADQAVTVTLGEDLSLASLLVSGQLEPPRREPMAGASPGKREPAAETSARKPAATNRTRTRQAARRLTTARWRVWASRLLEAADHAHQEGVVHREISPPI